MNDFPAISQAKMARSCQTMSTAARLVSSFPTCHPQVRAWGVWRGRAAYFTESFQNSESSQLHDAAFFFGQSELFQCFGQARWSTEMRTVWVSWAFPKRLPWFQTDSTKNQQILKIFHLNPVKVPLKQWKFTHFNSQADCVECREFIVYPMCRSKERFLQIAGKGWDWSWSRKGHGTVLVDLQSPFFGVPVWKTWFTNQFGGHTQ